MKQHAFVISLVLLAFVPACNGRGSARVRDLLGGDVAYPLIADGAQTVTSNKRPAQRSNKQTTRARRKQPARRPESDTKWRDWFKRP